MIERINAKLHVIAGAGFQGVVTDAAVFTTHKKHGLRHDFVKLHGVVAGATGHDVQRHTQTGECILPAFLPCGCTGCRRRSERDLAMANQTATFANFIHGMQDVLF